MDTENKIKAIETQYHGCRFRSRLEARWAVAFDAIKLEWVYEPQGFKLPSGWYLPDFWLPQVKYYAEVKPTTFTKSEVTKCEELSLMTGRSVLMLDDPQPDNAGYWRIMAFQRGDDPVELDWVDCWPFYSRRCHLAERRFYQCEGGDPAWPDKERKSDWSDDELPEAVVLARSARFEA